MFSLDPFHEQFAGESVNRIKAVIFEISALVELATPVGYCGNGKYVVFFSSQKTKTKRSLLYLFTTQPNKIFWTSSSDGINSNRDLISCCAQLE